MASVPHLHFCGNENNGIPPELSEINSEPVNALLADFTALLAGTSHSEEKQLKLISLLSLRLQTFNMKSYIHSIKENVQQRE
jgi:hypothetical protein